MIVLAEKAKPQIMPSPSPLRTKSAIGLRCRSPGITAPFLLYEQPGDVGAEVYVLSKSLSVSCVRDDGEGQDSGDASGSWVRACAGVNAARDHPTRNHVHADGGHHGCEDAHGRALHVRAHAHVAH